MPEFTKALSMTQLFNFKKDQQECIGAIRYLKIGTTDFLADMVVTDPTLTAVPAAAQTTVTQKAGDLKIVAGLSNILWDLGDATPVKFEGFLGVRNKQKLNALIYTSMIDINLQIGWVIYDYDPLSKVYFICYATGGFTTATTAAPGVSGLVHKEGSELKISITDELCAEVNSPKMYKFTLEVDPQPLAQSLYLAASLDDKVIKSWGRTGPAGKS